jgi:hypothetical protein
MQPSIIVFASYENSGFNESNFGDFLRNVSGHIYGKSNGSNVILWLGIDSDSLITFL